MNKELLLKNILEQYINETDIANDAMDDGFDALKSGLSGLKGYKAPEPKKEGRVDESLGALISSGLLAAPKLMEWLGQAVNYIAKKMSKNKDIQTGKGIENFGKKWESGYISVIKSGIKLTSFLKSEWMSKDGKIDEDKLKLIAKILYAVILGIALTSAVKGIISPGSAILKALEAVFGATKAVEIAGIAKVIASKMGISVS